MSDLDVGIVTLPPLRVASFHGFGTGPETIAWQKMEAWATAKGFMADRAGHRIFGFNNPDPSPGSPNYGYEFWMVVGPEVAGDAQAVIKQFAGGLYAVTHCAVTSPGDDIPAMWGKLVKWCEGSEYSMARHQWLEEHIEGAGGGAQAFVLDLYLPIAR
jgi:AraC family transcriptional regulator